MSHPLPHEWEQPTDPKPTSKLCWEPAFVQGVAGTIVNPGDMVLVFPPETVVPTVTFAPDTAANCPAASVFYATDITGVPTASTNNILGVVAAALNHNQEVYVQIKGQQYNVESVEMCQNLLDKKR